MAMTEQNKQILLAGGILGVTILLILGYVGFMFVKPDLEQFAANKAAAEKELEETQKTLKKYKTFLNNEAARLEVEAAFGRVTKRLPPVSDPIEIFDLLRGYISDTDVTFTYLEPGAEKRREHYTEYPFILKGHARYHQFGQLVNLVECNPDRLMRVTDFVLTNNDRRPSIHPMDLEIETYTFNGK